MREVIDNLRVVPLTMDCWAAFEDLMGKSGPSSRCWCMYWRSGAGYRREAPETNKAAFCSIVEKGPAPGLLAFAGDVAVGWCQLTPREALPWMDRVKAVKRVDDEAVWSISCFYIRKGYRRRGITMTLIEAAIEAARRAGAATLEAYPLDAKLTPSASSTGFATTFHRAGFRTIARHTRPRPIMRIDLRKESAGGSRQIPTRARTVRKRGEERSGSRR